MSRKKRMFYGVSAVTLFVFSLQLLGESASVLSPVLKEYLGLIIKGNLSAFGAGWLSSYIVLSGSPIAAIGIAFLKEGVISVSEYFMVASGSRIGAGFIVLLLGFIQYLQGKNNSLMDSMSVGVLSFVLTISVYFPAAFIGLELMESFNLEFLAFSADNIVKYTVSALFNPVVNFVFGRIGVLFSFIFSVFMIFYSLKLFDKAFAGLGRKKIKKSYIRFLLNHKWLSFAGGALLTFLTASVSLSIGIIVPLYNREFIKKDEMVPYIMGANVTTLADTILAAMVLNSSQGIKAVLILGFSAILVTFFYLLIYRKYFQFIKYIFDALVKKKEFFAGFLILLSLLPILAILI